MTEQAAKELNGDDVPWLDVSVVCPQYGYQYNSAKTAIHTGLFPVPVYKVGRRLVIDKEVHRQYFESKRTEGLLALKNNK